MNLDGALQGERMSHLDLSGFVRVEGTTTVGEVLERMRTERAHVALVGDAQGRLAGIFTERDALMKITGEPRRLRDPVDAHMTADPQSLAPDAPLAAAVRLMNAGHHRNVPVVDAEGHALGNLGQHAVIRFLTDRFPRQIYNLPPDPQLIARSREGA